MKPDLQAATFKCMQIDSPVRMVVLAFMARQSSGVLWATVLKNGAPDECISSFLEILVNWSKAEVLVPEW